MHRASRLIASSIFVLALGGCAGDGWMNGGIDENEETVAGFNVFDQDASGVVDEDEFASGTADYGTFGELDTNDDGLLDEDEFAAADREEDFGVLDTNDDESLSEDEFDDGLFADWDSDDSGTLDQAEWGAAEDGLFDV